MQLIQLLRRILFTAIVSVPALAQTTFSCPANQYVSTQQINAGQGCSALPVTVQTGGQNAIGRYTTAGTGTTVGPSSVQTDTTGALLGVNVAPTHALDVAANSSVTALNSTNTAEAEVINTNGALNTYEGLGLKANNAAASAVTFGKIAVVNSAVAAGAESGDLHFMTRNAGTLSDWWEMAHDGGLFSVGVTGGDKGVGTINATAVYVNGVAVGGGGYTPPTGNGFAHITAGAQDTAAVGETGTGNVVRANSPLYSLASAATTDIGSSTSPNVSITGTTAITSFGSTAAVGSTYKVVFAGAAPVLGSTTLQLATATNNLWPAVGDSMTCSVPSTAGSWTCGAVSSTIARSHDDQWVNLTPSALIHWRAKLANVRAKTGRAKVIFLGDSTLMGVGAGTGTANQVGAAPYSFSRAWATLGSTTNTPINHNSVYSTQCSGVTYSQYDPRVTLGTGWSGGSTATLGGGGLFLFSAGTVGNFSFTPAAAFDTVVVHYIGNGTSVSATTNVDGGASLGTINQSGANANKTATYTVTLGTHTVNIVPDNSGIFYLAGIETYNSAIPAVDVIQGSCNGVTSASVINNSFGWGPFQSISYLAPDLTVVDLTINDINAGTALSTYLTTIQTIITQAKLSGDVVLMVGPMGTGANMTNGFQDTYIAGLADLARQNNVVLMNTKARWTSYAVTNAVMPYYDTTHPGKAGYQDLAQWLTGLLNP